MCSACTVHDPEKPSRISKKMKPKDRDLRASYSVLFSPQSLSRTMAPHKPPEVHWCLINRTLESFINRNTPKREFLKNIKRTTEINLILGVVIFGELLEIEAADSHGVQIVLKRLKIIHGKMIASHFTIYKDWFWDSRMNKRGNANH